MNQIADRALAYDQAGATDRWIESVLAWNPEMDLREAKEFVLGVLRDGRDIQIWDVIAKEYRTHHLNYRWNEGRGGHWCAGYYDCLACYPD